MKNMKEEELIDRERERRKESARYRERERESVCVKKERKTTPIDVTYMLDTFGTLGTDLTL